LRDQFGGQGEKRMSRTSNALASYGRVANSENDPLEQVVMLYDGAIRFLREAAGDIEAGEFARKADHVNRALDILNYLQGVLDFERGQDVAQVLDKLYTLVSMKVLRASAKLDADGMRAAAELLAPVRDSWHQVSNSTHHPAPAQPAADVPPLRLGQLVLA
jgi:flagellar secretion chaperone FliS